MKMNLNIEEINNGYVITRPEKTADGIESGREYRENWRDAITETRVALELLWSEFEKQEKSEKQAQSQPQSSKK